MRIPRDLSGADLAHVTIPNHDPLRIGTLAATLDSVARHHALSRDALLEQLFSK